MPLAWQANYTEATKKLRSLGVMKATEDLMKTPALAMRPDTAAAMLFSGVVEGSFPGKKLRDCFAPGRANAVGARRIIDNTDRDKLIAGSQAQCRVAQFPSVRLQPRSVAPKPPDPLAPMTAGASVEISPEPAPTGELLRSGTQAPRTAR